MNQSLYGYCGSLHCDECMYVGSRLIDFLVEYILTNQQVAFFFLIYIIDTVEPWVGKAPCSIKQSVGKAGN